MIFLLVGGVIGLICSFFSDTYRWQYQAKLYLPLGMLIGLILGLFVNVYMACPDIMWNMGGCL